MKLFENIAYGVVYFSFTTMTYVSIQSRSDELGYNTLAMRINTSCGRAIKKNGIAKINDIKDKIGNNH